MKEVKENIIKKYLSQHDFDHFLGLLAHPGNGLILKSVSIKGGLNIPNMEYHTLYYWAWNFI